MTRGPRYRLQNGEHSKIGHRGNLQQRLAERQTGSPLPFTLIRRKETPERRAWAHFLHKTFARARVQGEWYSLSEADIAWIKSLTELPPPPPKKRRAYRPPPDKRLTPLDLWRRQQGWTQAELARRIAVRVNPIAHGERAEPCPRGAYLETLLALTGLPTDALVRPLRFLEVHPEFLADDASPGPRRGRPRPPEPPSASPAPLQRARTDGRASTDDGYGWAPRAAASAAMRSLRRALVRRTA